MMINKNFLYDKIKIFKTYKNILQISGAGMINLLACKPLTNFHIISHPLYKWSDIILKITAEKLNINFYEYDSAKVIYETDEILGDQSNRPWKLENMEKIISKINKSKKMAITFSKLQISNNHKS